MYVFKVDVTLMYHFKCNLWYIHTVRTALLLMELVMICYGLCGRKNKPSTTNDIFSVAVWAGRVRIFLLVLFVCF